MTLYLDTLAYCNRLRCLPASQKLSFGLVLLGLAFWCHWPVQLLSGAWVSWWIGRYAGIPWGVYGRLLAWSSGFLGLGLLPLVFQLGPGEFGADGIGAWGNVSLSWGGVTQAWGVFWRAWAALTSLLWLLCTIPLTQLLALFTQWRGPLVLIELMALMYRFIFLLLATLQELYQAQQVRLGYLTWGRQWHSVQLLAGQLLIRTLQQYQAFSWGIETRGFQGKFQVYTEPPSPWVNRYTWEAGVGVMVLLGLEWSYRRGGG